MLTICTSIIEADLPARVARVAWWRAWVARWRAWVARRRAPARVAEGSELLLLLLLLKSGTAAAAAPAIEGSLLLLLLSQGRPVLRAGSAHSDGQHGAQNDQDTLHGQLYCIDLCVAKQMRY